MSRKRSRLWRYAGWAAWAALRYGRTAVGMPKPYASHRMPSAKGVGDAGRPLVDRVEGGRCDRDRVGGRQRARVTGCAPGRTYGVAGPGLHRLGVHEAEALRSGDYAHVPVRLLGRRDQLADLARYAGPADNDVQERVPGLLGRRVCRVTHLGPPRWQLKRCRSGSVRGWARGLGPSLRACRRLRRGPGRDAGAAHRDSGRPSAGRRQEFIRGPHRPPRPSPSTFSALTSGARPAAPGHVPSSRRSPHRAPRSRPGSPP